MTAPIERNQAAAGGYVEAETTALTTPKRTAAPRRAGVNSLAASTAEQGANSLAREMRKGFVRQALYLVERQYLSPEKAVAVAARQSTEVRALVEQLLHGNAEGIGWSDLYAVFDKDSEEGERLWQLMQEEARKEFESGHRAAEAFESTDWQRVPWMRARYIALRESFIEQWQPRGGVELAMIDKLVESYLMQQFWLEKHIRYATTDAMATLTGQEREQAERFGGEWIPERVSEQEAIEFAALMADRWDRAFQRTLRALRDLRRYAPAVTINNARQVNIATDGGQQVNVQRARKRAAARSTSSGAKRRRRGLKAVDP